MKPETNAQAFESPTNNACLALSELLEERRKCECWFHRYSVAHICTCGELYDHSQGSCDEHRMHDRITFDSGFVEHEDTAKKVFDKLIFYGHMEPENCTWEKIYNLSANGKLK